MKSERIFFVYEHRTSDTNQLFYIGKGSKLSRLTDKTGRSLYWKNKVAKHGFVASVIDYCETEQIAFDYEISLIKFYREKGENLVNFTEGGEGWLGRTPVTARPILNKNTRKVYPSISAAAKESGLAISTIKNQINRDFCWEYCEPAKYSSGRQTGYVQTEQEKLEKSARQKGQKRSAAAIKNLTESVTESCGRPIKCLDNGEEFKSIMEAARALGINDYSIRANLSGRYKTAGNRVFAYV